MIQVGEVTVRLLLTSELQGVEATRRAAVFGGAFVILLQRLRLGIGQGARKENGKGWEDERLHRDVSAL